MNRKNAVDNIDKKNNISSIKKVAFIIACLLIIVFIVSLFYDPLNIYSNNTNSFAESIEIKPDQPIFNYTNKQIIPLQDLNINWQECKNTNKYIYKVIIIDGEPKNVNNEASMLGSISLAENLEGTTERNININQDNLMKDVWVKIAVAACNDKIQTWNSIYIYILIKMDNKYNIDKTIILNIINKYIKVKDNQYNIDLVKLGMDSILFVTIIIEIEEKYNIEIPPSILLLSKMNTINKINKVIENLLKNEFEK